MLKLSQSTLCLAVLGAGLAMNAPVFANEMLAKDGQTEAQCHKQAHAMHEKMQSDMQALMQDHAHLKARKSGDALDQKLDKDLAALEQDNAQMKAMHDKMMGQDMREGKPMHHGYHDKMGEMKMMPPTSGTPMVAPAQPVQSMQPENTSVTAHPTGRAQTITPVPTETYHFGQ